MAQLLHSRSPKKPPEKLLQHGFGTVQTSRLDGPKQRREGLGTNLSIFKGRVAWQAWRLSTYQAQMTPSSRLSCCPFGFARLRHPCQRLQSCCSPSAFEDEKPDSRTLDAKHVGMSNVLGELFVLKFHLFRWAEPSSAPLARTLNANLSRSRCTFGNSSIFRNIRAWP